MVEIPSTIEGIASTVPGPEMLAAKGVDLVSSAITTFGPVAIVAGAIIYAGRRCLQGIGVLPSSSK